MRRIACRRCGTVKRERLEFLADNPHFTKRFAFYVGRRCAQASIRDVAVLFVKAREVDFISASGSVTPLDLLHLSGHFGIPKMDGGMAVPVPRH